MSLNTTFWPYYLVSHALNETKKVLTISADTSRQSPIFHIHITRSKYLINHLKLRLNVDIHTQIQATKK